MIQHRLKMGSSSPRKFDIVYLRKLANFSRVHMNLSPMAYGKKKRERGMRKKKKKKRHREKKDGRGKEREKEKKKGRREAADPGPEPVTL